jgi:Na+/H+-dicarboxylate symporter
MFRKIPFILLSIIILISIIHNWIPNFLKSYLFAVSLLIKSIIIFLLPFLIFGLIFNTALKLARSSSKSVLIILISICISNFVSTMLAFSIGNFVYQLDLTLTFPEQMESLKPAFLWQIPSFVSNSYSMLVAFFSGIFAGWIRASWVNKVYNNIELIVKKLLKLIFLSVPFFIIGFEIQMLHDGLLLNIIQNYSKILIIIVFSLALYISLLYLIVNQFSFRKFLVNLKNMFPAIITGMASMSSAAALPLTIVSVDKNSKNSEFAKSIVPATVNIHLIGDCFAIPIFAFAILKGFNIDSPNFLIYSIFAFYFVLAKFSVAAVPGGGILVMLPILERYLGFNESMLSLITALYILFDPIITGANVAGNGAFSLGISKMFKKQSKVSAI